MHRVVADVQLACHLLVAVPQRQQARHVPLARRQALQYLQRLGLACLLALALILQMI